MKFQIPIPIRFGQSTDWGFDARLWLNDKPKLKQRLTPYRRAKTKMNRFEDWTEQRPGVLDSTESQASR